MACTSFQWKHAIQGLLDLGFSESSVRNCEEAKGHLNYLIECIKELHQQRKDIIDELETINLKTQSIQDAYPRLTEQHEIEKRKLKIETRLANHRVADNRNSTIQQNQLDLEDTKAMERRLYEEQKALKAKSNELKEYWENLAEKISGVIGLRTQSKLDISTSKKKKHSLLKETDYVKKLLLESNSKANIYIKGISEYLSSTQKVSAVWKNKFDQQETKTDKEREKLQLVLNEIQKIRQKQQHQNNLYQTIVRQKSIFQSKIIKVQTLIDNHLQKQKTLKMGLNAKRLERQTIAKRFKKLIDNQNSETEKLIDNTNQLKQRSLSISQRVRNIDKTLGKRFDQLSYYESEKGQLNSKCRKTVQKMISLTEEVKSQNEKTSYLSQLKAKSIFRRKQIQASLESEVEELETALDWEQSVGSKIKEEFGETDLQLKNLDEKHQSTVEELSDSIEKTRKQKESIEKSHEDTKAKTENYKKIINNLNDQVPKNEAEFKKIIVELKDQLDKIQQTLEVDKASKTTLTRRISEQLPSLEELQNIYQEEKLKVQKSTSSMIQFLAEVNTLATDYTKYNNHVEDVRFHIEIVKSSLRAINKKVIDQDIFNLGQLLLLGKQIKEILTLDNLIAKENKLFVSKIHDNVKYIKQHFRQISIIITDVIEAPDKLKNLQNKLLELIECTRKISLQFSDDMKEDFQEVEDFQNENRCAATFLRDKIEQFREKYYQFKANQENCLMSIVTDLKKTKD